MRKIILGIMIGMLTSLSIGGLAIKLEYINVARNTIQLFVNGQEVEQDNFIYKGRTYVQLRAFSELLNKKIDWNEETRWVSVYDAVYQGIHPNLKESVFIESVDLEGEVVVLKNDKREDVNLKGWKLVSVEGNQEYRFDGDYVLRSGGTMTIVSGKSSGDIKWSGAYIWKNSGDEAILYNEKGVVVSRFSPKIDEGL